MVIKPKIVIDEGLKKELDKLKEYPRETYEDVVRRLIKYFKDGKNAV